MKKEKNLISRLKIFFIAFGILYLLLLAAFLVLADGGVIWLAAAAGGLFVGLLAAAYQLLWKPYRETTRVIKLFGARLYLEEIPPAFIPYNAEMAQVIAWLLEYSQTFTTLEMSRRQAQYLMLQNQINPHFLYNTLESIRSEAMFSGLDSVAQMCEALANFFRYTISNLENLVTIDQELQNIKTYFYIQRYRFGNRLHLDIEYEEEDRDGIWQCLIPKLTLQPIVENAIIHGIEKKIGQGTVTISLLLTEQRLLIHVMDNGVGIDRESLDRINKHMVERTIHGKAKGGLAIANVNNRIKMLFGEAYGVTVFSTPHVGTDVEITLPHGIQPGGGKE